MATRISNLKDANGDNVYPITKIECVYNDSNQNVNDLLNTKANKDGSNIDNTDATSFRAVLETPKFVKLYDYRSSDANINWGKTGGITQNTTVTGKDFSPYRYLICSLANSGGRYSVTLILDLRLNPDGSNDFGVSMNAYNNASTDYRVQVNYAKTSIKNASGYSSAPILEIVGVIMP